MTSHTADAVYHQQCNVNFKINKEIPRRFSNNAPKQKRPGRPKNAIKSDAFFVDFLTNNNEHQVGVE